jgi:beta-N-acetylhexosaminidase
MALHKTHNKPRLPQFLCLLLSLLILIPSVATVRAQREQREQREQRARPIRARLSEREERFVREQLSKLRLEEKVAQMIMVRAEGVFMNVQSEAFRKLRHQVLDNKVGGIVLGISNIYEAAVLVNRLQELAKVPLLVAADLEAGPEMRLLDATSFPYNMGIGATGLPTIANLQGRVTAEEARAVGINMVFAPVADVNNNPANPIINVRSYGEDPEQVARFVEAFIRGAQEVGVMATAKHFPGHGDTSVDSHRSLPVIAADRRRLDAVELPPFRRAIAANVGAIMTAHIALPQLDSTPIPPRASGQSPNPAAEAPGQVDYGQSGTMPATLSPKVLTDLLRTELGFQGLIVTDSMGMGGIVAHFDLADAALRAVKAGADIILNPADADSVIASIVQAVKRNEIPEVRINASAERVLRAKLQLGLFVERFTDLDSIDQWVASPRSQETALAAAANALTLLRNQKQLIPLPSAADKRILYIVMTTDEDRTTAGRVLAAELQDRARRTEMAVIDSRSSDEEIKSILDKASQSDVIIAGLFIRPRSYRGSIALPGPAEKLMLQMLDKDLPLIVVSFGNPYFLLTYQQIGIYLLGWGDYRNSVVSQRAVARALFGEAEIKGKLPVSFPGLYSRGFGLAVLPKETK